MNWRQAIRFSSIGFAAQIIQVVFIRELLNIFYGAEPAVAITLGEWLIFVGIGSAVGALLTKRFEPNRLFAIAAFICSFSALTAVVGIRHVRTILSIETGDYAAFIHLTYCAGVFLALPCLSIGAMFSIAGKIAGYERVYSFESLGAAASGIITALLFGEFFNSFFLAALAIGALVAGTNRSVLQIPAAIGCIILLAISGKLNDETQKQYWKSFNEKFKLVKSVESPYGTITVLEYQGQYSMYQGGHLLYSLPDRGECAPLAHIIMAQNPDAKRVALIGGGISGFLKELVKYDCEIDYVELDPKLVEVSKEFANPADAAALSNPHVHFHSVDARSFLQEKYDIVICMAGEPWNAASNRFYTEDFLRAQTDFLAIGPVSSHSIYAWDVILERNGILLATLKKRFSNCAALPGSSTIFLASNSTLTLDESEIMSRLHKKLGAAVYDLNINPMLRKFDLDKTKFELETQTAYNPLEDKPLAPKEMSTNTDDRPVAYALSSRMWMMLTKDALTGTYDWLIKIPFWAWCVTLGFAVFAGIWIPHARLPALAFSYGFWSMAASVIVLVTFQYACGVLYRDIGLLFAAFMLGAFCATAFEKAWWFGIAFAPALIFPGYFAFMLFSFSVGAFSGFAYRSMCQPGLNASAAYTFDIIGGALAAFITAPVLIPILGIRDTFALATILVLAAWVGIILRLLVLAKK